MKPLEFTILISVESHDEKTAENYRNYYVVEKCIVSTLLKILNLDFNGQIEDLYKDCVKISRPYIL